MLHFAGPKIWFFIVIATLSLQCGAQLSRGATQTKPDTRGYHHFIFDLNSQSVDSQVLVGEAPATSTMDARNGIDFRAWHTPKARRLVRQLEIEYGIEAITMTSYVMPSFSAFVSDLTLGRLREDQRIERAIPAFDANDFSQAAPWMNQPDGDELVPYGKIAIGTNDALSTSNFVYLIDAGPPAHSELSNMEYAPQFNSVNIPYLPHAVHVAGILAADRNNLYVRGINPGSRVIAVNRGQDTAEIRQALDWVMDDAESRGIHAVANISSNSLLWADGDPNQLANFVRRLSNRLFVVQSAGNQHGDACDYAYGPTSSKDGVMVISAVDELGQQPVPFAINSEGVGGEPGANWGPCVEAWAPGQRVRSTWTSIVNPIIDLSGTSMSAPHVAALGARFGNAATTAVQRENYVRDRLKATGWLDDHGAAIKVPSLLMRPSNLAYRLLSVISSSADSSLPGYPPSNAVDGNYLSTTWNAGHYAPAWIELDLGSNMNVDSIRLSPAQYPEGNVQHSVYLGTSPAPNTLVASIAAYGRDLEPLAADLGLSYGRYLRIYTNVDPAWVSWREIELYGLRTDEMLVGWLYLGLLDREADTGGYSFWLAQVRAARCTSAAVVSVVDQISSSFVWSPEFQARGLSNQGYVNALYRSVFRRDPDAGGLAFWTSQLDLAAETWESLRIVFITSPEFSVTESKISGESCIP